MSEEQQFEIAVPNVSEAIQQKLDEVTGDKKFEMLRFVAGQTADYLKLVREQVKDVENFWSFALLSHVVFKQAASVKADRQALTYLTNVELIQDAKDPRPFEIVFHFKENPYFTNSSLSKKYTLPKGVAAVPEDGSITKEMREFEIDDLETSVVEIDWKDDLCKKYPRKKPASGDDFDGDFGSFFHFFTDSADLFTMGATLQQDILPDIYDYFRGLGENCDQDDEFDEDDEELDEEDELDDEEIDLEEPKPKKKQRTQ